MGFASLYPSYALDRRNESAHHPVTDRTGPRGASPSDTSPTVRIPVPESVGPLPPQGYSTPMIQETTRASRGDASSPMVGRWTCERRLIRSTGRLDATLMGRAGVARGFFHEELSSHCHGEDRCRGLPLRASCDHCASCVIGSGGSLWRASASFRVSSRIGACGAH
jgi:hypothetical protein